VLVVEDEDTTRLMLETRLRWAGHRVRATGSAREAQALLEGVFIPEVVVSDMFMPGGSGLGLISALRRHPECADLPVVLLSGRALPGDVSAGEALGARYLAKPCSLADLTEAIDAATGATGDELESLVRRRLGDLGAVDDAEERDFTALLLRTFVENAPSARSALDRAVQREDAAALEAAAHRLGGAAANLGAAPLAAACAELEQRGRDGLVDDAAERVAALVGELDRTCEVFLELAEELAGELAADQPEA
jgi:CheY-like chemotaxis protein